MKRLPLVLLLACLMACQRQGVPTEASAPVGNASAGPSDTEASNSNAISLTVTPSSLTECVRPVEAIVQWDASAMPAITTVEIWASDGSEFKLFAAGGAKGEAKTGPWTQPGSRFRAIDPSNKKVLAELRVSGPEC